MTSTSPKIKVLIDAKTMKKWVAVKAKHRKYAFISQIVQDSGVSRYDVDTAFKRGEATSENIEKIDTAIQNLP